eukprot:COSAG02_NODE_4845_length_4912_cov_11.302514_1_plen_119_part_00
MIPAHSGARSDLRVCEMFGADQLYLVIEESDGLTYDEIIRFQRRYRARETTPLDETIRDKVRYVTAQTIVPGGMQYYSARDLHVCSHYQASGVTLQSIMAQQESLPLCPTSTGRRHSK